MPLSILVGRLVDPPILIDSANDAICQLFSQPHPGTLLEAKYIILVPNGELRFVLIDKRYFGLEFAPKVLKHLNTHRLKFFPYL